MMGKVVSLPQRKKKNHLPESSKLVMVAVKALFVLLCLQLIWSFFSGYFLSFILRTEIVEEVFQEYYITADGLLGFQERIVVADKGGKITWLREEGQRVAVEEPVAKIVLPGGEEISTVAPVAGIFSPYTDGLEGLIYPYRNWQPDKETFLGFSPFLQHYASGQTIVTGAPLFKIVENFNWYYSLILTEKESEKLLENGRLWLDFVFAREIILVNSFHRVELEEGFYLVIFSLSRDLEDFYRRRWEKARIIYRREKRAAIPVSALITKEGKEGVLRLNRSTIRFAEVEVFKKDEAEGKAIVGGLDPGWEIVKNPRFFREGQRL